MANCPNCNGCCVEVCQEFISPRCECPCPLDAMTVRASMEFKVGQAVAENSLGELVYYHPTALPTNLDESNKFVGFTITYYKTDADGQLISYGTNHPLYGNPCPLNRARFFVCGIFLINRIPQYLNFTGLDLARAIVAINRGHFVPRGENDNGEVKIY